MSKKTKPYELPVCQSCNCEVMIPDGMEHTGYCHDCAQDLLQKAIEALNQIAAHKGLDRRGHAMTPDQLQLAMRSIALEFLDNTPDE